MDHALRGKKGVTLLFTQPTFVGKSRQRMYTEHRSGAYVFKKNVFCLLRLNCLQ